MARLLLMTLVMANRWLATISILLLAVACGSEGDEIAAASSESQLKSEMPCDVQKLVAEKCTNCHAASPLYGAPMGLTTRNDFMRTSNKVRDRIGKNSKRPMPPGAPLNDSERAVIESWLDKGTPASECATEVASKTEAPPPCEADQILKAPKPYTMNEKDDQYVCFGVDVENANPRHVFAMYPNVDNAKITHHILVFESDKSERKDPWECESGGAKDWKVVGGWAPGGGAVTFPPEAGFPEKKGTTHWVVQLHYNNSSHRPGMTDHSSFGLCTTDKLRQYDAGLLTFGALKFKIPPRKRHGITCEFPLDERFRNVHFFGASPHMHELGKALFINQLIGDEPPKPVLEAVAFDFNEQRGIPLSVDVAPGQRIQTRCEWENSTDAAVEFGEGTGAEMCLGFVSYYPAIKDEYLPLGKETQVPVFNWTSPSNNLPIMDSIRESTGAAIPYPTCREDAQ